MKNLSLFSGTFDFIGSRERLQKIVARSGGEMLPGRQFRLPVTVKYHRRPGFTFWIGGSFVPLEERLRITYQLRPTAWTWTRYLLCLLLFLASWLFNLADHRAAELALPACLLIALLVLSFWRTCRRCGEEVQKLFQ